MMREGREVLDSTHSRSSRREMIMPNERIERGYRTQHSAVDERGYDSVPMRGYEDGQLRKMPRSNDQEYPVRDRDTASKFQWMNLLKELGNSVVDGREEGYEGSRYGRYGSNYDVLPVESEMIGNRPSRAYNAGSSDYHGGGTRNMSRRSVEDPNYRRHIRNVTDHAVDDARCYRQARDVSDLPTEDAAYSGRTRKVAGLSVQDDQYRSHSRTVTADLPIEDAQYRSRSGAVAADLPIEGAQYRSRSRVVTTDLPIEDADYRRGTRNVAGPLVEDRQRFLPREYPEQMDREISMRSYEEHNCLRVRNEDSPHSLTPRSHSNGQRTPIQRSSYPNLEDPQLEVFHHLADGRRTGGNISPSHCYGSPGMVYLKANDASHVSHKGINCSRAECNPNMGRHVDCIHPEGQRSGKLYRRPVSQNVNDDYENVQDYHDHRDLFGKETSDFALSRHGYTGNSRNYDHTLEEEPMNDVRRIGHNHKIEYGRANLRPMNRYLEEEGCYETDSHGVPYEHDTWTYPVSEEGASDVDEDAHQRLQSEDIDLHDQPKTIRKRKRGFSGNTRLLKHGASTLDGRGALSYDDTYHSAVPENESVYQDGYMSGGPEYESVYPNRSSSSLFKSKANARMSKTDRKLPFGGLSRELRSRLSKPGVSGKISVKTRLNPRFVPRQHGSQASKLFRGNFSLNNNYTTSAAPPHGQAQRTSVKKRLKAAPPTDVCPPDSQFSQFGLNSDSRDNIDYKNSRTAKEAVASKEADPDYSILRVKPTEKDPPDNSEELKRLVDNWFIKCMLYLNANPGRLKKFKEQGKAGTLTCSICLSSKEFTLTKDVATHAFTSPKVGLRAPHLGFHKALCVLMGWDPAIASNGRWVCKSLSEVEAQSLKEDLILWPPVVIIHNRSAGDFFTTEKAKSSFEQLENALRDMGLSEGKTTICDGKPGSSTIRLVKFNGTVSGLQEAERLHHVFSEKKHGRAQLQEVDNGVKGSEGVAQEAENQIQDTLYGYLGVVEDFDKLNYEMRRHCFAKSKKEILGSLDTAT